MKPNNQVIKCDEVLLEGWQETLTKGQKKGELEE